MRASCCFFCLNWLMIGLAICLLTGAVAAVADPTTDQWIRPPAGVDFTIIDHTVRPGDDFYRFANGQWLDTAVIPDGIPRLNTYSAMQQDLAWAIRFVITAAAESSDLSIGTVGRGIGDFFASGMDTIGIEVAGLKPLQPEWDMIDAIDSAGDLARAVARLQMGGVSVLFDIHDPLHWELKGNHQLFLRQGGLGLSGPASYEPRSGDTNSCKDSYRQHLTAIFTLAGQESRSAAADARATLVLESELSRLWEHEGADPRQNDKSVSVDKLSRWMPGFDWKIYLQELGIPDEDRIILRQPDYFQNLGRMMKSMAAADWRPYLRASLLHRAAAFLGKELVAEHERFHSGVLRNRHRSLSREQRVARAVERALPWAVGELYCQNFFTRSTELAANELIEQLKEAFIRLTRQSHRLDAKQKAWQLEKLAAMEFRIGGPTTEADLSGLVLDRSSYLRNVFAAHRYCLHKRLARLGQPWDRNCWTSTPQSLDAKYNRNTNRVTVVASLFQPPLFDRSAEPAANLGMIGTTIAHEMTHGFDNEGRRFDKNGESHWWQRRGSKSFDREAEKLASIFSGFEVLDGQAVNSRGTLMENIADLGGLAIAFEALQSLLDEEQPSLEKQSPREGQPSAQQRFFLAYAQKIKELIRDDALAVSLRGPHAPSRFRVLGPLIAFKQFGATYGLLPRDQMFREDEELVRLW